MQTRYTLLEETDPLIGHKNHIRDEVTTWEKKFISRIERCDLFLLSLEGTTKKALKINVQKINELKEKMSDVTINIRKCPKPNNQEESDLIEQTMNLYKSKYIIERMNAIMRIYGDQFKPTRQNIVDDDQYQQYQQYQSNSVIIQIDPEIDTEIDLNEQLIEEREDEIKDIAHSVTIIAEMFRDIKLMIEDQGKDLDIIEANIESTVNHTEKAKEEIKVANKYQNLVRNKMCWLLLFIIIILVIVVIIAIVKTNK